MRRRSALATARLHAWCWVLSHVPPRTACALLRGAGSLGGALTRGSARRRLKGYLAKGAETAGVATAPDALLGSHFRHSELLRFAAMITAKSRDTSLSGVLAVHGWENLEAALANGRGCILAGAHFGAPALPGAYAACRGLRVCSLRNESLRPLVGTWRGDLAFNGATPIFTDRNEPPAQILKRGLAALQEGAIMLHLVDGVLGARGVTVPFFGTDVFLRTGAMDLARIARCPILPAFAWADNGRLALEYHQPDTITSQEEVEAFARRYAGLYEKLAAAHLDNATWKHLDRFVLTGKDVVWYRGPVEVADAVATE